MSRRKGVGFQIRDDQEDPAPRYPQQPEGGEETEDAVPTGPEGKAPAGALPTGPGGKAPAGAVPTGPGGKDPARPVPAERKAPFPDLRDEKGGVSWTQPRDDSPARFLWFEEREQTLVALNHLLASADAGGGWQKMTGGEAKRCLSCSFVGQVEFRERQLQAKDEPITYEERCSNCKKPFSGR